MIQKIVNLTPHIVTLFNEKNEVVAEVEPSGMVARAQQEDIPLDELSYNGAQIPCVRSEFGEVENLPEPQEGTILIVSSLAAQAVASSSPRQDVFVTSAPVRDEANRIIGCRRLARI